MIKVGCCGYPTSREKYREVFSLVELNSTFYGYPSLRNVKKWRDAAPKEFEFTVKAHQDISHIYRLKIEPAREPFERMKEICRTLDAHILLIQTPASFKPDDLKEAERFFKEIDREGLTIVWETRGPLWEEKKTREKLRETLEALDVIHVTDPFRIMPVYTGRMAYFRLHGLGPRAYYYQFADEELTRLHNLVGSFDTSNSGVYVLFNNLSMFEDGKRFISFLKDGYFPPLTGAAGLDSVRIVVAKTGYPSTKSMMMRKLGWRLVELEDCKQVKLSELLKDLPSKTYRNVEEVLQEIKIK